MAQSSFSFRVNDEITVDVTVNYPSKEKKLLTWADIEAAYKGSFAVPLGSVNPDEFGYSRGRHCQLSNGNVLMSGHVHHQRFREVRPPSVLDGREGEAVGEWKTIHKTPEGARRWEVGGVFEDDLGYLHWSGHEYYNAEGADWPSFGRFKDGVSVGPFHVHMAHHQFLAGYMSPPPSDSTYDFLAGQQGTNGAAFNRYGPNLSAVSISSDDWYQETDLLFHSKAHPAQNWWIADKVHSMLWVETDTHWGVLCFGYKGAGEKWYGERTEGDKHDPYRGGKGYHATAYEAFCWIYHPRDLLDVAEGLIKPWEPLPAERVTLIADTLEKTPVLTSNNPVAELTASFVNGRLILAQEKAHQANRYSKTPVCSVFDLTGR